MSPRHPPKLQQPTTTKAIQTTTKIPKHPPQYQRNQRLNTLHRQYKQLPIRPTLSRQAPGSTTPPTLYPNPTTSSSRSPHQNTTQHKTMFQPLRSNQKLQPIHPRKPTLTTNRRPQNTSPMCHRQSKGSHHRTRTRPNNTIPNPTKRFLTNQHTHLNKGHTRTTIRNSPLRLTSHRRRRNITIGTRTNQLTTIHS